MEVPFKYFHQFGGDCKISSCTYYLTEAEMKSLCLPILKSIREIVKISSATQAISGVEMKNLQRSDVVIFARTTVTK